MKVLGLDLGEKRIGIAVSDELGMTAQGRTNVEYVYIEDAVNLIKGIAEEERVSEIVVGFPLNMDGTEGPQAKKAAAFADNLKTKLSLPVKLWDERLSTMSVQRMMISADVSRAKRKMKVDKLAAQVILQGYLDSLSSNKNE